MSAGTALLTISLVSTDAAGIPKSGGVNSVAITRTLDLHASANSLTSATINTDTAVPPGTVADGEMLAYIQNTDTVPGHYILVRLDFSGTKRTVAKLLPGEAYYGRVLSTPYVQSPVGSVPYDYLLAAA
jgi:hypothetical protein